MGAIQSIFGGVGDMFQAAGDRASAKAYQEAATIALQNKAITQESTGITLAQAQRQITQSLGAENASTGGAGLQMSGTAKDLMQSSMQQGALTKQLVNLQGSINANGYQEEADAAQGQAAAANAAASAATANGIGGILGGIFSDARLKHDIRYVSTLENGVQAYLYRYRGSKETFYGYIAQQVQQVLPEAVYFDEELGVLRVHYTMIDPLVPHPLLAGSA